MNRGLLFILFVSTLLMALATSCDGQAARTQETTVDIEGTVLEAGHIINFLLLPDGNLWGWGYNEYGQLGDGTTEDSHTPVWIMNDVVAVSAGDMHTIVLKKDGSVWAWGSNTFGQLALMDRISNKHSLIPVHVMNNAVAVSAGGNTTMVIKDDSSMWGWGGDHASLFGEKIIDGYDPTVQSKPVQIMDNVAAVSNNGIIMVIRTDGSLWGWGWNETGAVGYGPPSRKLQSPILIMEDISIVSTGGSHTMAIKPDGSLWGWGGGAVSTSGGIYQRNAFGQVGAGTIEATLLPTHILEDVVYVSASQRSTAAIRSDGSLWVWGFMEGRSGWRKPNTRLTPEHFMDDVAMVSIGGYHGLVVKTDGSLWAWGNNSYGQFGDGTTKSKDKPVKILDSINDLVAPEE